MMADKQKRTMKNSLYLPKKERIEFFFKDTAAGLSFQM